MKFSTLLFFLCIITCGAYAQYAPQAGIAGSTAIAATSGRFVGWATGCSIKRGLKNIAIPDSGYVTAGDSSMAIGSSDGNTVSLGDSGVAVLTFAAPIYNGAGPDFAVFENGFTDPSDPTMAFLELGFVEVSSDGVNYFRFPATSNTQDTTQIWNGMYTDASKLNNLAGKYIARYGTPFDLDELAGIPGLDVNHVTHVRIIDVVGDIGPHACKDHVGNAINDPYPTAFATGGFDLDAVGAIHQVGVSAVTTLGEAPQVQVYPNPAKDEMYFNIPGVSLINGTLTDVTGKVISTFYNMPGSGKLSIQGFSSGVYYLVLQDTNGSKWVGKIIKL